MNSVGNGDRIEQIYVMRSKEEKQKLKKERRANRFGERSPNDRIRRVYKKRIMKELKIVPNSAMTPAEIEKNILMNDVKQFIEIEGSCVWSVLKLS